MEKYLSLKKDNKHSIVIIQNGVFYNTYGNDAIIISYMTEYKLYYYNNSLCTAFPKSSLNIILSRLRVKNISYIVLDKTNKNTFLGTIDSYINYYKEASIVKQKELLLDEILNQIKLFDIEKLNELKKYLERM